MIASSWVPVPHTELESTVTVAGGEQDSGCVQTSLDSTEHRDALGLTGTASGSSEAESHTLMAPSLSVQR